MPNYNEIALSSEEITQAQTGLNTVISALGGSKVTLSDQEKQHMLRAGDQMEPYIQKVSEGTTMFPQYIPGHINVNVLNVDLKTITACKTLLSLTDQVRDMLLFKLRGARSDAYSTSRQIEKGFKAAAAAGEPEIQTFCKALDDLDPISGRPSHKPAKVDNGSQTPPVVPVHEGA